MFISLISFYNKTKLKIDRGGFSSNNQNFGSMNHVMTGENKIEI
jgi:hypothetical protein